MWSGALEQSISVPYQQHQMDVNYLALALDFKLKSSSCSRLNVIKYPTYSNTCPLLFQPNLKKRISG